MKRIIDMLLKMIWPAIVSFVLLVGEVIMNEIEVNTVDYFAGGNSVSNTIFVLKQGTLGTLINLTIAAVVIYMVLFVVGFVWNIIYSIIHRDEE